MNERGSGTIEAETREEVEKNSDRDQKVGDGGEEMEERKEKQKAAVDQDMYGRSRVWNRRNEKRETRS